MPYFDREDIENLSRLKTEPYWVTSFFLSIDKSLQSKKQILLNFKNLVTEARSRLESMELEKDILNSLERDLETIGQVIPAQLNSLRQPGLALFCCSAREIYQTYYLPHPPRNRVIFDQSPYLRPLIAILDRYHRICALVVSRREARWFKVFMGEASLLETLVSDVPGKVREGGWEGYESKRIERHIEAHVHDHLKKVSEKTFALFKKNHFDWLFLGCEDKLLAELDPLLHTYLKEKLKGRLNVKTSDPLDKVRREAVKLEVELKKEEEAEAVRHFVSELEGGGLAVAGLKETLRQLNGNNLQLLLVSHNFSREGRICPRCHLLFLEEKTCPSCRQPTQEALDIVDEALEAAMLKGCPVRHITPPSRLDHYGKIGAFLRYKA